MFMVWMLGAPCGEPQESGAGGAFEAARFAPADVKAFVHVERAAEIRRELADRPIARWINGILESGQAHKAWRKFARAADMDETRLFDLMLGRRFTLMVRNDSQWAIITELDEAMQRKLLRQLRVRVLEPRAGMALSELPEHEMLLARSAGGEVLIVAPARHSQLFNEVLDRIGDEAVEQPSLNSAAILKEAGDLGPGRIAIILQHARPMGGHSCIVADVKGDQLTIKSAAQFENAPFTHRVTQLTCDFSPIALFEKQALVTLLQPTDTGDGPVDSFVAASLGEGLASGEMRANTGDRRLIIVGEAEGRQLEKPVDLLTTTVVCCVQAKDGEAAVEQLDSQMVKVTARIRDLGKGAFLVQTPHVHRCRRGEPREVDLSGAGDWFTGGFPIMKNVSLSWTVADGPHGAWFVVGTHRLALDEVVGVLREGDRQQEVGRQQAADSSEPVASRRDRFDQCGFANGVRIGRHLRSWSDQAEQFAPAARQEEFRTTLQLMSDLAAGMQTCRWQLSRPTANEMRLNVQIKLAAPESTRAE